MTTTGLTMMYMLWTSGTQSFFQRLQKLSVEAYHFLPVKEGDSSSFRYEHVDNFKQGDGDGELYRPVLGHFGGWMDFSRLVPCETPIMLVDRTGQNYCAAVWLS